MNKTEETIKIIRSNKPHDVKLKALNEYAQQVSREKGEYCSQCGEPLSRDRHKIWCKFNHQKQQ